MSEEKKNIIDTTDIWFVSFLRMNGYNIHSFDVLPKSKSRFYFEMTEEEWKKMKLEFNRSTVSDIKMQLIALKDMLH